MNMPDGNNAAELRHDRESVDPTPYMAEALTSIVDGLMSGEKVRGLNWTLHDFLRDQYDLHELVMGVRFSGDWESFDAIIEGRLRAQLEDHEAVHDLAAEMAAAPDEQS